LVNIAAVLKLFNNDPDDVDNDFKDRLELTIKSPLSSFKDEEYTIRIMDKIGEISVNRKGFNKTISKKSNPANNTNLQQAVDQQISGEEEQGQEEPETERIDLSYLPDLDYEFKKIIKNEFFDRIRSEA
jgi:hypothetical protein